MKKKRIILDLNEELLNKLTEEAKNFNISRNALISMMLSNYAFHLFSSLDGEKIYVQPTPYLKIDKLLERSENGKTYLCSDHLLETSDSGKTYQRVKKLRCPDI